MKILNPVTWVFGGAIVGGLLGILVTLVISFGSMMLAPKDPSAGSVGIVIIILLPGGVFIGLISGAIASFIHRARTQSGNPIVRRRKVFILLGVIFGVFGYHNFYAGYYKRGVAQLLITLLSGWLCIGLLITLLWAIRDMIKVTNAADGTKML